MKIIVKAGPSKGTADIIGRQGFEGFCEKTGV